MSRKLASIRKVVEIKPIERADTIEVAKVDGWECVVKKGDFKIGDLAVYFEEGSFLPIEPRFEFLRKSCYKAFGEIEGFRLRTIKLKGQISQGLLLRLDEFPELFVINPKLRTIKSFLLYWIYFIVTGGKFQYIPLEEGLEVTDYLGVVRYQTILENLDQNDSSNSRFKEPINRRKPFPSFIPKTDEERVQNLPYQKIYEKFKNEPLTVTEKLDGTSFTAFRVIFKEDVTTTIKDVNYCKYGVCSRNFELEYTDKSDYSNAFIDFAIEDLLQELSIKLGIQNLAIQGELIGPGIQGNKLNLKERELRIFNVYNIDQRDYVDFNVARDVINKCISKHEQVNCVPLITATYILPEDRETVIEEAVMQSTLNLDKLAEGIVIRFSKDQQALSFKAINNEWLLKYGE
ncbi:MAG: hypothetical protein HC836_41220 [Richelia sp. RM2_1_2]|nr:hypothetical protein [Richelia sp. RM2_1_2]